ncbi:glycosyltransferase [Vulgatibacter sp.]|uniref:glycosyltransferase n=1 Tax=Vulgatibacter sp. TaxID=1971226 RepID=UPI003567E7A8
MKIAYFVGAFPSVSETFVLDQITGLLARGHEVEVYGDAPSPGAVDHPEVEAWDLLSRTRHRPAVPRSLPARLAGALPLLLRGGAVARATLQRRFGREGASLRLLYASAPCTGARYDAIHAHFGPNGLLAARLRLAGAIRGPLVTTFHGYDLTSWQGAYADLIEEGDLFLPISDRWRERLVALGFDPRRIAVHRMGVDTAALPFLPRRAPATGPVRLVSVARLVEKKGIAYAIDAVAQLRAAGHGVDYTVVGDGPLRAELEARIAHHGGGDAVRITGWRDRGEVAAILRDAHVLVAPSVTSADGDQEGIPVALMEAMACGLPIAATRHSGIPELVEEGVSGLLVPERDATALAEALRRLIAQPDRWEAMGRAGRARVDAEFDIHRLNDRLVELLSRAGGA